MELRMKFLKSLLTNVVKEHFDDYKYLGPLLKDEESEEELAGSSTFLIYCDGQPFLVTFDENEGTLTITAVMTQTRVMTASCKQGWVVDTVFDESIKLSEVISLCNKIKKMHISAQDLDKI